MAAHGQSVADVGNQIFVTLRRGKEFPPRTVDVRIKYEQTLLDVKKAVAERLGVPVEQQQLFLHQKHDCRWDKQEAGADVEGKTLLELGLHTGFGLQGYDLRVTPDYWPPVKQTPTGLAIDA